MRPSRDLMLRTPNSGDSTNAAQQGSLDVDVCAARASCRRRRRASWRRHRRRNGGETPARRGDTVRASEGRNEGGVLLMRCIHLQAVPLDAVVLEQNLKLDGCDCHGERLGRKVLVGVRSDHHSVVELADVHAKGKWDAHVGKRFKLLVCHRDGFVEFPNANHDSGLSKPRLLLDIQKVGNEFGKELCRDRFSSRTKFRKLSVVRGKDCESLEHSVDFNLGLIMVKVPDHEFVESEHIGEALGREGLDELLHSQNVLPVRVVPSPRHG
mmetsp:Transcript_17142/g.43300  ORF Transcript_17142/g.43300 Transcript_17142/m.43300 type:complete len:268 (+) Transcript_17142:121-924(+)